MDTYNAGIAEDHILIITIIFLVFGFLMDLRNFVLIILLFPIVFEGDFIWYFCGFMIILFLLICAIDISRQLLDFLGSLQVAIGQFTLFHYGVVRYNDALGQLSPFLFEVV